MNNTGTLLLLAGAGVFILMASRRRGATGSTRREPGPVEPPGAAVGHASDVAWFSASYEDLDIGDANTDSGTPRIYGRPTTRYHEILKNNMDPYGRAQLGMLYQVRASDTPISVCCEALYGTRECNTPEMRACAIELLIRMYCGPWNQALYAVEIENIHDYPSEIDDRISVGISFEPIYQDNRKRIEDGLRPTAGMGFRFPLVWVPMIDVDLLESGIVTTRGMYHSDTYGAIGGNMIDPPKEILDIGFEYVTKSKVGCNLPEGDFRKILVTDS